MLECDVYQEYLDSAEATRLLDVIGFDAADEYLAKQHPEEQELYVLVERTRARLARMTVTELMELSNSKERQDILEVLRDELSRVLEAMERDAPSAKTPCPLLLTNRCFFGLPAR